MRLKLTYIKGHSYVIECDKYNVLKKKNYGIKKDLRKDCGILRTF